MHKRHLTFLADKIDCNSYSNSFWY